jgi:N6-adenosine-specific RNA methylase IME4/ParB-like chromosome segregation protein Spo0J
MPPVEHEALREDIRTHGLNEPLAVTSAGVVLDGHQRLQAAHELGLAELPVREIAPADEHEYIVRAALRRKHYTAGQRLTLAIELAEIQERLVQGRRRQRANLKQYAEVATLPPRGEKTREVVARLAGVSARSAQAGLTLRQHAPDLYQAVRQGTMPVATAARQAKQQRLFAETPPAPPLPEGTFDLILADPPWQLGNPDGEYAPENYYPTLPLEEIKALPVPAADSAVLFLWAVNSHLLQALDVLEAWGFSYRSNLCWAKDHIGMGVWLRQRHELLLLGTRGGYPAPPPERRVDSVIEAKKRGHSRKPDETYERIERMYPTASKVELFARGKPRAGWTAWGNEVTP